MSDFLENAKKNGYNEKSGLTILGFAVDSLSASQCSCLMVHNVNIWLEKNFGLDVVSFYSEATRPSLEMDFPRFNIGDSIGFKGHLFSTSLETTRICEKSFQAKKYWYIQDIEWERSWCKLDTKEIDKIKNNEEIIKICRSEDHKKYIEGQGWKIHPIIVEDFNLGQILQVIKYDGN